MKLKYNKYIYYNIIYNKHHHKPFHLIALFNPLEKFLIFLYFILKEKSFLSIFDNFL